MREIGKKSLKYTSYFKIFNHYQNTPTLLVPLTITDIVPRVNSKQKFCHIVQKQVVSLRKVPVNFFQSSSIPTMVEISNWCFSLNDKRSRKSWLYNHNLRLLLALHRIQLPDGYTLFYFVNCQLSIATSPHFGIIASARNLPDGFHNERIIIHCACRCVIHITVV